MSLARLRAALAAFDNVSPWGSEARELRADVIAAAREVCAANPEPPRCPRCGGLESADTRNADELCWCPEQEPGDDAPTLPQASGDQAPSGVTSGWCEHGMAYEQAPNGQRFGFCVPCRRAAPTLPQDAPIAAAPAVATVETGEFDGEAVVGPACVPAWLCRGCLKHPIDPPRDRCLVCDGLFA